MLLFLIGIEPLTQKILFFTKIHGIFFGTTSLKVSHNADNLTIFISSSDSFTSIREIIKKFSFFSSLKINQSKTTIISNSPALLSSFRSTFPPGKIRSFSKIFGINFFFQNQDLSKKWNNLNHSLPYSTLAALNPRDSSFPKLSLLTNISSPNYYSSPELFYPSQTNQISNLSTI